MPGAFGMFAIAVLLFKKLGFLEPEKRTQKSASECGWVCRRISADTNVSLQAKRKKCRSVELTNAPRRIYTKENGRSSGSRKGARLSFRKQAI